MTNFWEGITPSELEELGAAQLRRLRATDPGGKHPAMKKSEGGFLEAVSKGLTPSRFSVHAHAAALYVAMLRAGYYDEATEFAEWYLETFDHDLED